MGAYGQLQVFWGAWASSADTYILQMYYYLTTAAVFVKRIDTFVFDMTYEI